MLLITQFLQNFCQLGVALVKACDGIHDLVIGHMIVCLIQLYCQICQFLGMGCIVAHHVLHQSQQFIHGSVAVMMLVAMFMQMIMRMGMRMVMGMGMIVGVSMGVSIVGMFMGMCVGVLMRMLVAMSAANMIVVDMHSYILLLFIYIFRIHKQVRDLNRYGQATHFGCPEHIVQQILAAGFLHLHHSNAGDFVVGKDFL